MKKFYLLMLMATMLLIGTSAWAQANGKIKIVRTGVEYEHLQDAFTAALDGDVLELTDNMTEAETKAAWFGEPTSGSIEPESENYYADHDRSITLDLKGHTYYNDKARFIIALTRGQLRIKSTGGEGEIKLKKHGIAVYGTYLKINAKTQTPFSHLIIEENVKITEGDKAIVLTVMDPEEVTGQWKWAATAEAYPLDYCCEIFPTANYGVANGARIDIYGKVDVKEYALQVNGNVRSALEYLNEDGTYNESMGIFPLYYRRSTSELFLPGTMENNTEVPREDRYKQRILKYNYFVGGQDHYAYHDAVVSSSNDYVLTKDDNNYSPYVHIYPSAVLKTNDKDSKEAIGFYSAGYSRVYIEGTVEGSTGVYVKSGDVELHDATITSNYSDDYWYARPTSSGVEAGGSAIVIESNATYTGNIGATVSGDTKATGSSGYAIEESVTNSPTTDVDKIDIQGGTFVGGTEGTIKISEETADANEQDPDVQIIIYGGSMTNNGVEIGNSDLETFLNSQTNNTHVTIVDGTMVVSQGGAPKGDEIQNKWKDIADLADGSNAAWTGTGNPADPDFANSNGCGVITSGTTVTLGELQMISGSGANAKQILTVKNGASLEVQHLMMNNYAQIIVEAGGKLIVKGTQGIVAPSIQNILLKASETEQAIFLFHPNVTSNRHPNATVEFISNSITNTPAYSKQRFGIPTWKQLSSITTKNGGSDVQTAISSFSYVNNEWTDVSWINVDGKDENLDLIADPFAYYQMQHNTPNVGTVVTMTGELYGNTNPVLNILGNSWNGYANSYMAPIDAHELIDMIPNTVDKSFQIYELSNTPGEKGSWVPVSELDLEDIKPMQAFLLRNTMAAANVTVNYGDAVYYPTSGETKPSNAPARRSELNSITKAKLIVRGESYVDRVVVAEDALFSAEFDNGYDCRKYMNEGINLYVSADEKMGIYATDDIENTYVGFQAVNGGNYTIEFANVQGEELMLIDHETNARIAMVEGNTYEFSAAANSVNDYRFEIVATAKMPTAIENTEAVKSAKGIYTITGQYVGEMNVWNSLPAGVYVVNGEKRVK